MDELLMKPVAYYTHYNRNVGRIKHVGYDNLVVSVNPGHSGGDIELPKDCVWKGKHNRWEQVEPKLNARILLCIDDDTGDIVLLQQESTR